jgi:hypothetical protein
MNCFYFFDVGDVSAFQWIGIGVVIIAALAGFISLLNMAIAYSARGEG